MLHDKTMQPLFCTKVMQRRCMCHGPPVLAGRPAMSALFFGVGMKPSVNTAF